MLKMNLQRDGIVAGFPYPRFTGDRRRIHGIYRCNIRGGVKTC